MQTQENAPKPRKKRGWFKTLIYLLVLTLLVIQVFPISKNNQAGSRQYDISTVVNVPDSVRNILQTSCYDCHSNNTVYPWYTNIQPFGWFMEKHIVDGKKHLNFDEFASIQPRQDRTVRDIQDHKLEEIKEQVETNEMPLKSYLIIHTDAKLSEAQKSLLYKWVQDARNELKAKPAEVKS